MLAFASGLLGAAILAVVLTIAGALDTESAAPEAGTPTTVTVVEIREIVTEGAGAAPAASVALKVVPSIVTVEVGNGGDAVDFDPFASGSGVVLTGGGYLVTNHHVIDNSDRVRVIFQDGRTYPAEVVGSDALTDLAVLSIAATGLTPIELGDTSTLSIGDPAIAVGNPLGLRGGASLTVGVVSAFDREVNLGPNEALFGMLQTDAPITEGSSGGALVDGNGRLIGITSAIGVSNAGAEGIGFAIPVELVSRVTDEIIATGTVRHAFLGIQLDEEFEQLADGSRIAVGTTITGFVGDDPAARAGGLLEGDVIVRFDENDVRTREDLINGIRRYRVGDVVEIEVIREGQVVIAQIALGERPPGL
jgi:S1-C subfamily serine protease